MATPSDKLDDAIHEFLRETDQIGEGHVTGWVIGVSMARIQTEDPDLLPLAHKHTYVIGHATSLVGAAGLARYLSVQFENHFLPEDE